jgi:class 3 adenylate cyclase/tetratricopeptide (TPR) repeat protein
MDLGGWLRSLGLGQYEAAFLEHAIDDTVLPSLTAEDLRDLGVGIVGHRRKLLDAIAALRAEASTKAPPLDALLSTNRTAKGTAERRQLTVMFCDLVGSTSLSARLDPEDMRNVIGVYRKSVTDAVARFDGFIAQYLGDGVLVYFGYPHAHEDDAERAVRTGLAAVAAVDSIKGQVAAELKARVGIATGLVVVGEQVGAAESQERIAIGETPNLAARLQSVTAPGEVVIAASTRRLVGGMFDCSLLGPIEVKGLPQPVEAWRVRGESIGVSRFEAFHAAALTPLVGRQEEIEILLRHWHQAKLGNGRVVLLAGEPGIGKSRIAESLFLKLKDELHLRLRYFCSPHNTHSALYPFIAQLERAAGFALESDPGARLNNLEALLKPTATKQDLALIAELLGVPVNGRCSLVQVSPREKREMTLTALLNQLVGVAAQRPVLMVFEDAHWIDPTSLELLDRTVARVADLPVMLIVAFRPEFQASWVGQPHVTMLPLNRLDRRNAAAIIAGVSKGKAIPDLVAEQILARADGVPLFIEELTSTLLESGMMRETPDSYVLDGPLPPFAIPTTLQASLAARLDRLAPVKNVAQIGAAIGREFSHELIAAVAAMRIVELDAALERLTSSGLISRRGTPPDAIYSFKHALVQDAAYATLLKSRRQQLHAKIGGVLVERFSALAESLPEVVAHHFTEARLATEAISYWLKAGQLTSARSANSEAVSHLEKGLVLLRSLPEGPDRDRQELGLQCILGPALNATHGHAADATLEAFERARALIHITGDLSNIDFVMEGLTSVYFNRSAYRECLEVRLDFLEIAERQQRPSRLCIAHKGLASIYNVFGNFALARTHGERALSLYDGTRDGPLAWRYGRDVGVSALCHLSIAKWHLGDLNGSRSHFEEGLALAEGSKHPNTIGYAHAWATILSFMARDYRALQRYAAIMVALGREHGLPYWTAWGTCLEAPPLAAAGEADAAHAKASAGLAMRERIQARSLTPVFLSALAEIQHCLHRDEEALSTIGKALEIADCTEERWMDAELLRLKGDIICAEQGGRNAPEAERLYRQALSVARAQGSRMFELRSATSLSQQMADTGRRYEARNFLAPLFTSFTDGLDSSDLKAARALLDQLV